VRAALAHGGKALSAMDRHPLAYAMNRNGGRGFVGRLLTGKMKCPTIWGFYNLWEMIKQYNFKAHYVQIRYNILKD